MVFLEFPVFLEVMETSEVAGPGPNPREIEISFGADGPLACVRGPWARQEHLLLALMAHQPKQSKSGIDRYSIPLWPGGGNGA